MRLSIVAAVAIYLSTMSVALPSAQPQPSGEDIFRFDTFGSEQLWTDVLQMQHVISSAVSPKTALSVGLKVDVDALPQPVVDALASGQVNLDDPAVTVQLLKLNAVVGVIGKVVGANDNLATVGITCALCHSTVDDSFAPGIGRRLDGWANTTLNPGAIIALSPAITDKAPYLRWGAGKYDPRFRIFDGTNVVGINSPTIPVVIPPAFGLKDVGFETFNARWADLVLEPLRRRDADGRPRQLQRSTYPRRRKHHADTGPGRCQAARACRVSTRSADTAAAERKLQPRRGTTRREALCRRGRVCDLSSAAAVHRRLERTQPERAGASHPVDIPTDPAYAARSATKQWRTTPLRALWQHPPYFHDGSAADLLAVVNRYNDDPRFSLGLSDREKADLVEFLKTL